METQLDSDISAAIVEFLARDSADNLLLKKLINALPTFNPHPCLQKAMHLRSIRCEIQAGEISERILDYLERIERIDSDQRIPIPDSMKEAYYAVLLDCTAKYLAGGPNPNPNNRLSEAANRIWRGRLENLERSEASNLVSDRLRNLGRQVEAAFEDEEVRRCLIAINTRKDAIHSLRLYIREAFASMEPPVLVRACLRFTSRQ